MSTADTESNTNSQRIHIVDSLRGFALAGVCLVHMLEQYFANIAPAAMTQVANASLVDQIIMGFNQVFLVGKFYMIFSLLFGVSFFIQIDKRSRLGQAYTLRFLWRILLLFGFGFLHHFFYRGDILMLYAILGILLIPMNALASQYLVVIAVLLFLGLGRIIGFLLLPDSFLYGLPDNFTGSAELGRYYNTLKSGTLADVFAINAIAGMPNLLRFQLGMMGRGYITFGLFLLGIVLARSGFFQDLSKHQPLLKKVQIYCVPAILVAGILTGFLFSRVAQPLSFSSWPEVLAFTASDLVNLSMSLLICCTFLLISLKNRGGRALSVFAPYGRMALSNYLLQAFIGTTLFFGWGCSKLGELRNVEILVYAICVIAGQIAFSHCWMRHFNYGPLEWLWRSATQVEFIPLSRNSARKTGGL